jgi:hypothetical protein
MERSMSDDDFNFDGYPLVRKPKVVAVPPAINHQYQYEKYQEAFPDGFNEFATRLWDDGIAGFKAGVLFDEFARFAGVNERGELYRDDRGTIPTPIPSIEDIARMERQEWLPVWFKILRERGRDVLKVIEDVSRVLKRWDSNSIRAHRIDLRAERPAMPMLVKRLIPSGVVCAVWGARESGKSFLTLDLAACIATGTPFLGCEVVQGKVLLLQIEDPAHMVIDRVRAWEREHDNIDLNECENFHLVVNTDFTFVGGSTEETWDDQQGETHTKTKHEAYITTHVNDLVQQIEDERYSVVIIDNVSAGQDDSSNMSDRDVTMMMRSFTRIRDAGNGCTPIIVFHGNEKDTSIVGLSKQGNLVNTMLHTRILRGKRVVELDKAKWTDKTHHKPIKFSIGDSGYTDDDDQAIGVVRFTGRDDGAESAIEKALSQLEEPSGKNAIYRQLVEMGHKIDRNVCLKLIDDLSDDERSPVIRVGQRFTLDD